MTEFITWAMLGTFAGAVTATTIITEIAKRFFPKPDPKWFALIIAFVIVLSRTLFTAHGAPDVILALFNWLIVTGASVGLFEGVVKPVLQRVKVS